DALWLGPHLPDPAWGSWEMPASVVTLAVMVLPLCLFFGDGRRHGVEDINDGVFVSAVNFRRIVVERHGDAFAFFDGQGRGQRDADRNRRTCRVRLAVTLE